MDDEASDEQLMNSYGRLGESLAFQELYRRYENRLYVFFSRRLYSSPKETAADLFQKTWLKVHLARAQFDHTQKFSSWFFAIAFNCLRDHWGSAYERGRMAYESSEAALAQLPAEDIEEKILLNEELMQVRTALERLPASQREAVLLSEWDGLSALEIGNVLELSENAVRQLLFRARNRLKALLKEGGAK